LASTEDYPETISASILTIQQSLPEPTVLPSMETVLSAQMQLSAGMAGHLESLAAHYDQMAGALREIEAGEQFAQEDLQGIKLQAQFRAHVDSFLAMNRDTQELPSIIMELDESCNSIESS